MPEPNGRGDAGGDADLGNYVPVGNGSGWVYRSEANDGGLFVVTNQHVVEGVGSSERIVVRFSDRSEAEATVVGLDKRTDIAVLRLDEETTAYLHPAAVAETSARKGQVVFAFGSPFRFDFSMSQGIVSALGRSNFFFDPSDPIGRYEYYIQTDAAINPGNSGGPLVNVRGEVIGMNTAIASRNGAFNGIGLAIPADLIVNIADRLIRDGSVSRGFLGVRIADLNAEMAATFDYEGEGVLIAGVIPGGAAEAAGLRSGDIVVSVDDEPMSDTTQLRFTIAALEPGVPVELTIFRDGRERTVEVELGGEANGPLAGRSDDPEAVPDADRVEPAARLFDLGITGLRASRNGRGVVVTSVRRGSPATARRVGLEPGTRILSVMGVPVSTPGEVELAVAASIRGGSAVRMYVAPPGDDNGENGRYVLLEPAD